MDLDVEVRARHIPGELNVLADGASRWTTDRSGLMLHPRWFRVADQTWGPHDVDLFAARENAQLPRYYAWSADPYAEGVDAFARPWADLNPWINPPFAMIGRILQKILLEAGTATVLIPLWPTQSWFPLLRSMLCDMPIILPRQTGVFWTLGQDYGPLPPASWGHAICRVSGLSARACAFARALRSGSSAAGGMPQAMTRPGETLSSSSRDVALIRELLQSMTLSTS